MSNRSNKFAAWATAAGFAMLAPLAQANPNLVADGGFESGDFPPAWTTFGDLAMVVDCTSIGVAHTGVCAGVFGNDNPGGGIFQSVATTPQGFLVSFWLANIASDMVNSFSWSWNNGPKHDEILNSGSFPYSFYSGFVTGTGGLDELRFTFTNPGATWLLDDVSVEAPEPGTLALMAIALLGAGTARRRKDLA